MLRLALLASLVAVPAIAQQQPACMPTVIGEKQLVDQYGEALAFEGAMENDIVFQLWANVATGTWSAVIKRPDGVSCLIGEGQGVVLPPVSVEPARFGIGPEFDA